ncbi:dihydroxyacetone kinase subunit DhaK [Roseococcus sp.]|uniref:dihydroxyacetone kinase subunit DhaK n=1 Tax=Roseococcus sp. TaxID=2109646 RepID=UPI003BAD91D7
MLIHKIAGAAAASGRKVADEVAALARAAAENLGQHGRGARRLHGAPPPGVPASRSARRKSSSAMGIHGEQGVERGPMQPADALVDRILATNRRGSPPALGRACRTDGQRPWAARRRWSWPSLRAGRSPRCAARGSSWSAPGRGVFLSALEMTGRLALGAAGGHPAPRAARQPWRGVRRPGPVRGGVEPSRHMLPRRAPSRCLRPSRRPARWPWR